MEVQEDGENVALKEAVGEKQWVREKILSLMMQTSSKDNSTTKHSIFCLQSR